MMVITQKMNINSNESKEKTILFRESFVFVLDLIRYTELLEKKKKDSLAKKLFEAGTTFGKTVNEARFVEKNEKLYCKLKKMKKNAQNMKYLLQLCKYSATYPNPNNLISDLDTLTYRILKISETLK